VHSTARERRGKPRPRPRQRLERKQGTRTGPRKEKFDALKLTREQLLAGSIGTPLDLEYALSQGTIRARHGGSGDLQFGDRLSGLALEYRSLSDVVSADFSDLFHSGMDFRNRLRAAIRKDIFDTTPAYAGLSSKAASLLLAPESSLQGSWKTSGEPRMKQTTALLSKYGCPDITGDDLMHSIGALCGERPSTHWIDIVGVQDRSIAHSFHQDTGLEGTSTVLWGFPRADEYVGTGVFSHAVKLLHSCCAPQDHPSREPIVYDGQIPEECVIRPVFETDNELLVYRDVDVLHSSPDVTNRTSLMRFM